MDGAFVQPKLVSPAQQQKSNKIRVVVGEGRNREVCIEGSWFYVSSSSDEASVLLSMHTLSSTVSTLTLGMIGLHVRANFFV